MSLSPWLQPLWRQVTSRIGQLPHGVLLSGPGGVGKRDFAEALAARLLCERASGEEMACGSCDPCVWRLSANHPDLHHLVPAAETAEDDDKKQSRQIVIDQVRALQAALSVTSHHGGRRVVIIDPVEAMNPFTANALLKLLEEPPADATLLLVSSQPRRLLPTIRSRCQQWAVARPDAAAARAWLDAQQLPDAQALLELTGGLPLAAQRMAEQGAHEQLARFIADVERLPGGDPVKLAGQWESWLKSKEAIAGGFDQLRLIDWMQRWITDLVSLRLGGRVRFFASRKHSLERLAERLSVSRSLACYNEINQIRRLAKHPLNLRLTLEDMLLRYVRAFSEAKT